MSSLSVWHGIWCVHYYIRNIELDHWKYFFLNFVIGYCTFQENTLLCDELKLEEWLDWKYFEKTIMTVNLFCVGVKGEGFSKEKCGRSF